MTAGMPISHRLPITYELHLCLDEMILLKSFLFKVKFNIPAVLLFAWGKVPTITISPAPCLTRSKTAVLINGAPYIQNFQLI